MAKKKKKGPKKVVRTYLGPDWYLEQQSVSFHDRYPTDMADLATADSELDAGFGTTWGTAITNAIGETRANAIRAQLREKTTVVDTNMQACLDKYDEVMLYAKKAFGKRSPTLAEFGSGDFHRRAGKSKQVMFDFMTGLNKTSNRLKTALIAKGYSQPEIDAILTVRDALQTNRSDQYDFKVARPELTQKRIGEYNGLHAIVMQIIEAAKIAYKTNPAKLSEYVFNPPVQHRPKPVVYEAPIPAGTQVNAVNTGITDQSNIEVENLGDTDLQVDIQDNPTTITPDAVVLKKGRKLTAKSGQIPDLPAYFVNLKNLSNSKDGKYRVTVK